MGSENQIRETAYLTFLSIFPEFSPPCMWQYLYFDKGQLADSTNLSAIKTTRSGFILSKQDENSEHNSCRFCV